MTGRRAGNKGQDPENQFMQLRAWSASLRKPPGGIGQV
jgi:hypothetical protein